MRIFISLFIFASLLISFTLKAQDVIVKINKEEIQAKVLEVEESVIKYKKFDFLDGPTYSVNKNEVFMILYKNGKRETFETNKAVESHSAQAQRQQPQSQTKDQQAKADPVKAALEKAFDSTPDENADHLAFNRSTSFLQLGVGVGGAYMSTGAESSTPALQVRYEFPVSDKISVGGVLGYASANYGYDDITYSYLLAGARGNYHFLTSKKFDPYFGVTLGYNNVSIDSENEYMQGADASAVLFGAQIGANYYFSKGFGAWADLGYGLGYLNIGIVFKF